MANGDDILLMVNGDDALLMVKQRLMYCCRLTRTDLLLMNHRN
jgi:hypothetical protein